MKLTSTLLLASIALVPTIAIAQATASTAAKPHPAAHPATSPHSPSAASHSACSKLPEFSPKIPALPANAPCAKPLYTLATVPSVKIEYAAPLVGQALAETLGIETSTFSLNYIDAKIGTGELAAPHKWYTVKYTGYLTDGTKFDSSDDHPGKEPFSFPYGQHHVIVGWDTGLTGMRVGGKRRLIIPWQLAYGPNGKPPIPGKADLVFDIEFVSQSDAEPKPPAPPAAAAPAQPVAPTTPPAAATPATPPAAEPSSTPAKPQ
ncbi:MAG TPA: FKBP-type peptidyl-prolyl cis-trans isomerase [Acidobacteriaceae bacterium]|jgi:peptidylprolyl isomerase